MRWKRSTLPFPAGWYGIVKIAFGPNLLLRWEIIASVNCGPLSEMITRGTPCRHICADHRASAIVEALELGIGIASGHVVL